MPKLANKIILITGASSGIGRTIAISVSKEGGKAVLIGRNKERLDETASQCPEETVIVPMDIGQPENFDSLPRVVTELSKKHGKFSGMVHSAGIYQVTPLRALYSEEILNTFYVNALAGVMLAKGFSSKSILADKVSLVFISSVMGHVGQSGVVGYCMSKGAVEQAVKSLAIEMAALNVRVNAVAPSVIATPVINDLMNQFSNQEREQYLSNLPGGIGQPEDVAAAVVFLLSDESQFITGISLPVDGGYLAR
jgi:NAD(P)-dependent dehydrogenase (short-subunit alcohol dehydrogenase family)